MPKMAQFQARDALAARGYSLICFERRQSSHWDAATRSAASDLTYELLYAPTRQIAYLRLWWQTKPYARLMTASTTATLIEAINALPDLTSVARAA